MCYDLMTLRLWNDLHYVVGAHGSSSFALDSGERQEPVAAVGQDGEVRGRPVHALPSEAVRGL